MKVIAWFVHLIAFSCYYRTVLEYLFIGVALSDSTCMINVLFSMCCIKAGVLFLSHCKLCEQYKKPEEVNQGYTY